MHVNPLVSDGRYTIGYDADGLPGIWEGYMLSSIDTHEWHTMHRGARFIDTDDQPWILVAREEDGVWCWQGPDGRILDPEVVLKQYGDK
jgi:hypothetical protein